MVAINTARPSRTADFAQSRLSSGVVVGYGSIGARHAANIRRLRPKLDLTVVTQRSDVVDGDMRLARDLEQALASMPSFAVIATPSHLHAEQVISCLRAGVACYIEKPLAVTLDQAQRISRAIEAGEAPPITFAGCNLRLLPSLAKMRALLAGGAIGKPARAHFQAGQWLPDWRPTRDYKAGYSSDTSRGGGVILDLIHEIDQARWLFGEFQEVAAVSTKASTLGIDAEDAACVIMRGVAGAPVIAIGLDYISRRPVRRYEVVGEEGTLVWDLQMHSLQIVTRESQEQVDCGPGAFDISATYTAAMSEFLGCIVRSEDTSQDVREGLRTTELALRVRTAAGL